MRMVTSGMFPSPVEYLCIFVQVCFVRTEIVLLHLAHIRLDRRVNQLLSEVRSASESQKEPLTRERLDISGVLGQNHSIRGSLLQTKHLQIRKNDKARLRRVIETGSMVAFMFWKLPWDLNPKAVPKSTKKTPSKQRHSSRIDFCRRSWQSKSFSWYYCWWFRNPAWTAWDL